MTMSASTECVCVWYDKLLSLVPLDFSFKCFCIVRICRSVGCILDIPSSRISLLCSLLDSSTPWWNKFARIHTDKQAPSKCTRLSLSRLLSPMHLLSFAHSLFANNHSTFHMDTRIHTTWTLINYSDTDILYISPYTDIIQNTTQRTHSLSTLISFLIAASPHFHTYECSSTSAKNVLMYMNCMYPPFHHTVRTVHT